MSLRLLVPAALIVASNACFATRNDVRILQEDILSLRSMQARGDSARARQLTDITTTLNTTLVSVRDSVRDLGTRLVSFQGSTRQELYSIGQQLLQLGTLMGQSQTALRDFSANMEERNRQAMEQIVRSAAPPVTAGDTTKPAPAPVSLSEGPNVLYQIGRDQLRQNSWSAARDAFNRLILQHPNSDLVPDAFRGIGESFDAEGDKVQGDSVFRLVVQRYPSSEAAATSLYKLGLSLARQGKRAEARAAMQQVVRNYPGSDVSTLATEWLARNPLF
ncbi:MAG TPA: tetratricopeptide repeat protein [Gemmatimonadaceae bacterium]